MFEFDVREQRETAEMDRVSAQLDGAQARERQARADRTGAITAAIGGATRGLATMAQGGAFSPKETNFQFTDLTKGKDYSLPSSTVQTFFNR